MKPAPFDYVRAESVDEALEVLSESGEDARVLAGGQSLIPILNMRLASPEVLLDINAIPALQQVREEDGWLVVGAGVTQAVLQARQGLAERAPLLANALPYVGHFQTRNRGTVCGSLVHADPSAELPLCLVTLGGEVTLRSAGGERRVPARDFFQGLLLTARRADELVVEAHFPLRHKSWRYAFDEVAMRHGDFAIAAVAVATGLQEIRIGVGGVADRPVVKTLPLLAGDDLDDALNDFAWSLDAQDDHHASAAYRREMVRHLGRQLIQETRA